MRENSEKGKGKQERRGMVRGAWNGGRERIENGVSEEGKEERKDTHDRSFYRLSTSIESSGIQYIKTAKHEEMPSRLIFKTI